MVVSADSARGFVITNDETDPVALATSKWWEWGFRTTELKQTAKLPIKKYEFNSVYKGDDRMPSELLPLRTSLASGLGFVPTNLIPEYLILGSSASAGAPEVHTITNIKSGSLPTFCDRGESSGGGGTKVMSAIGSKTFSLNTHLEVHNATGVLVQSIGYNSIDNINPPSLATKHNGAVLPTDDGLMNGTEQKNRYRWGDNIANRILTWDSTAYKSHALLFDATIVNVQFPKGIANQLENEFLDEGVYQVMWSMLLWRGEDDTIYDDFLAGNQKTLTFKIFSGATNYKQYVFDTASIEECVGPEDEENPVWDVKGIAKNVTVTGIDGIDKTEFFGE